MLVDPLDGDEAVGPLEAVMLGPLSVRAGLSSAWHPAMRVLKHEPNIASRVLRLDGKHLALVVEVEVTFELNDDAVG